MIKKKILVVANWKMNPQSVDEVKDLVAPLKRISSQLKKTHLVLAPSFIHLPIVSKIIERSKKISLGAQNCHEKNMGAHTGEVSPSALYALKTKYVILGHSERRKMGETNQEINAKIKAVLGNSMTPIICIGETARDRDGSYLDTVRQQIKETLHGFTPKDLMDMVIAYEPVWAIGKSWRESMTGTDMHEMSLLIKKILGEMFGDDYGRNIKILYGGSVEAENAEDLLERGDISGFLVGHASLVVDEFKKILKTADEIY